MSRARLIGLLLVAAAAPSAAQVPSLPPAGAPLIRLSGELGSYAELYHRSGAGARRPDGTGRVYLTGTAVLFGSLRMGVDLLVSTEDGTSFGYGSSLPGRQSIGQLALHPEWRWGRAHLGTFSDHYSPLTYSAVQVRGAGVDLQPGRLRFAALGGRAMSAVYGGATTGSYRRTVAGGLLGYGRQAPGVPSSFVTLTVLRAWDDPNSLAAVDTTLPPNAPTPGGAPVNPYAVTPEENLVMAANGGLTFLQGKLAWRAELASAVHTRDVRAAELDSAVADVPGVLRGLITPRVGTHADYAFASELQLRQIRLPGATDRSPRTLTASLGYRYVGPGYTSLGVASLANDIRAVDARASVRFARWSTQVQVGQQHDNLAGQKVSTTGRYRLAGVVSLRVSRAWNASFRSSLITMDNGDADSLRWMDYRAWSLGIAHAFSFGPRRRIESVTLDYQYQDAGDANPRRAATSFSAHSANARLAVRVTPTLQLAPSAGFTRSGSDTLAPVTRVTYGIHAAWRLWGGRLTTTGAIGRSRYSSSHAWTGMLGSRLHLTSRDDLVLNVQVNRFADTAAPDKRFNEETLELRWARRL